MERIYLVTIRNSRGFLKDASDREIYKNKGFEVKESGDVAHFTKLEMTMKEIGLTLDLSESRVSQMHSSILARLKAQMQHRSKEF